MVVVEATVVIVAVLDKFPLRNRIFVICPDIGTGFEFLRQSTF